MQSSLATLLAFLFAVTTTLASPLHARFSDHAIKDSHTVPPKWSEIGSASPDQIITLQIGLKQGNFPELERHLYEGTQLQTTTVASSQCTALTMDSFEPFPLSLWSTSVERGSEQAREAQG